jgi:hypothetical protein
VEGSVVNKVFVASDEKAPVVSVLFAPDPDENNGEYYERDPCGHPKKRGIDRAD